MLVYKLVKFAFPSKFVHCMCVTSIHLIHTIMLLIKLFRIGPVTGPRLAVLDRGRRPRSNTANRGPVTGPIRNNLINEIFIN